ncbi:MAG: alpha/beta hydrolase family protein [Gammaproteobacteria bacterium]
MTRTSDLRTYRRVRAAGIALPLLLAACGDDMAPDEFAQLAPPDAVTVSAGAGEPPAAPHDAAALRAWQVELRAHLGRLFAAPAAAQAPPAVISREPLDAPRDLLRELVVMRSADGTKVPAILQRPRQARACAAIVVIPGHVPESDSGLRQVVYDDDSYQAAAATRLAHAGFVTLSFELRGFGLLGRPLGTEHRHVAYNALLDGRFYKALVIDDARAAIDVLLREPGVDGTRLGVTGASLGGELAVTLAALDERVAAVAWSAYGGRAGPFRPAAGTAGKQRHYCHIIPGSGEFMRDEDVTLLIAPRPALGLRGSRDYKPDEAYARLTAATWATLGAPERFEFETIPERGHEFFVEQTIDFFVRTLGPACE